MATAKKRTQKRSPRRRPSRRKPEAILITPEGAEFPAHFVNAPGDTDFDRTLEYRPTKRGNAEQVMATASQWAEGGWRWRPVTTSDQ